MEDIVMEDIAMEDIAMNDIANNPTGVNRMPHVPVEIWTLIAEQIRHRKTLKAFASTCKAFHAICQPLLYAELEIYLHLLNIKQGSTKSLPPGLKHTEDFRVVLFEWPEIETTRLSRTLQRKTSWKSSDRSKYATFLTRVLSKLEKARSFEWVDLSFVDEYETALILSTPSVLEKLKDLPLLEHVSIQFAGSYLEDYERALRCFIPLKGFRNLASLELYQFYGKENVLLKQLSRALKESPNLKKLGLGLATDCNCDAYPETYILQHRGRFLEKLCLSYASQPDARPLPLETLRLGNGICLWKAKCKNAKNYLAKLVKTEGLQTLHIFNGLVQLDDENIEYGYEMVIDTSLLKNCKSLHQLQVARLSHDIIDWLSGPASTVQELFVTHHYSMYEDGMDLFNLLKVNKLTTLYIAEVWVKRRSEEDAWSDTDSSDSNIPTDSESSPDTINPGESRPSGETTTWEDLSIITPLDRVAQRNDLSHLKRLSLCLEFQTQWTHFSEVLPRLKGLEQLSIRSKSHHGGAFPPKESSLWPDITQPKEIALQYAKTMHKLCPSLRYIGIGYRPAWHIQFCNSVKGQETGPEFIPLTEEDLNRVEIFTYASFPDQSALLGPDYHEDRRDDEVDFDERMEALLPPDFIEKINNSFRSFDETEDYN